MSAAAQLAQCAANGDNLSNTYLVFSPAADLLARAIEQARPLLADQTQPTKQRIRILWATARRARDLGASDVVAHAFMQLAIEVDLIDQYGRWAATDVFESTRPHGRADIDHIVRWPLRGWNPFGRPLT
jgi:hypothetical protein